MRHPLLLIYLMAIVIININGQTSPCSPASKTASLDVNNVRAGLLNGGDLWWNLQEAQYEIPKGSGKHALFAGGMWIGGIDDGGQLRVAGQTYRQSGNDYWPGPIMDNGTTNNEMCNRFDGFFDIQRSEVELMEDLAGQYDVANGGTIPENEIPENVKHWPAKGNPLFRDANFQSYLIEQKLAPFVDLDGDGIYEPTKGDHPQMRGDEMFWWVFNDVGNDHSETGGQPLGIEVHATAYAYATNDHLDNTTFYRFEVLNKGQDFDSLQLGIFVDHDLGYLFDDYVGCDTTRNMGIGYNGDTLDESASGYGEDPPYIGIDLLKVTPPVGDGKGMTSFMHFISSFIYNGNPEVPIHYYNYLRAKWKDESHLTWGGAGHNTGSNINFLFPSEPDEPNGWSECQLGHQPFDRRMVLGSGPYVLKKGGRITLDFAAIWARCPDYEMCPSFDCIQVASDQVQAVFDNVILPTGIEKRAPVQVQVSPNPARDHLRVKLDRAGDYDYKLYNSTGQVIRHRKMNSQVEQVSLDGLADGIYFLSIKDGWVTEKIMVQSR